MTRFLRCLLASSAILLGSSAAAFAAPIANLSFGTASANLSYFSLGSTDPVSVGTGSGGGSGKDSYLPLTVHAALSQFQSFYQPYFAGRHFATCVLSSNADGQAFKIELKNTAITSSNAQVSDNTAAAGGESPSPPSSSRWSMRRSRSRQMAATTAVWGRRRSLQ